MQSTRWANPLVIAHGSSAVVERVELHDLDDGREDGGVAVDPRARVDAQDVRLGDRPGRGGREEHRERAQQGREARGRSMEEGVSNQGSMPPRG